MANPVLEIAGVDRTSVTKVNTLSYGRSLNRRESMNCILTVGSGYRPVVGDPIVVKQNSAARWGGLIETIEESAEPGTSPAQVLFALSCSDWWRFLDKRLFAGDIGGESLHSAMTRLAAIALTDEGFSISGVPNPGPTISNVISFNYATFSDVLNKLTQVTGLFVSISPTKVITMSAYASNPAPYGITFSGGEHKNFRIRRSLNTPGFRNNQIARTQYAVTSQVAENFTGDGVTSDFFVSQFITSVVSVTVGGVAQVVGQFGIDGPAGPFDVYYDVGGVGFHFYATGTATPNPPGPGVAVVVTYIGPYRNVVVAKDLASIAARAAIEGGSGQWDGITEERNVSDANALADIANGLLRANSTVATILTSETNSDIEPLSDSLNPGHRQVIDLTDGPHDVDDTFLVESVRSKWTAVGVADSDIWEHEVTHTDLEPFFRPEDVMQRILEVGRIGPDSATASNESQINGGSIRLLYGPTVVILTGNTTIDAPIASPQEGAQFFLEIVQGSGPYTITWGSGFASGIPTDISDENGSITRFHFIAKSDHLFYRWHPPGTGN